MGGGGGGNKGRLLGEEAEKTLKGQRHMERNCHCAAPAKLQHLTATWPACLILERFCQNGDCLKLSPRL